jgi:thioredoxin-dependent peroxiredoxin
MPLKPGERAPDFTLLDQRGQPFSLKNSLKERQVWHLIYFYPKADTPGCTTQACGLRDLLSANQLPEDAAVIGISPDPPKKQAKFDEKYGLGFPLLADEDHSVADAYGVWGERSMYGKKYMGIVRSAFLIDGKGRIEHAWYKISPKDTPTKLVEALASGS